MSCEHFETKFVFFFFGGGGEESVFNILSSHSFFSFCCPFFTARFVAHFIVFPLCTVLCGVLAGYLFTKRAKSSR